MLAGEAKPKQIITIVSPKGEDTFFLITELQNDPDVIRAYEQLGGGVVYLNPSKPCKLVTSEIFKEVL